MSKINILLSNTLLVSSLILTTSSYANEKPVSIDNATEKNRQAIILTEKERTLVLQEMRSFLESVQTIISSLASDDWESITKAARKSGRAEQEAVPATLGKKLPKAFKKLGGSTHKAFDALALDSKDMEDKQQTLNQLGSLMKNCVACHAIYKFETEK